MREGGVPFGLAPCVIYAVPAGNEAGWHLRLWLGSLADFQVRIGTGAEACRGYRVIGRGKVAAAHLPYFVADHFLERRLLPRWRAALSDRDMCSVAGEAMPARIETHQRMLCRLEISEASSLQQRGLGSGHVKSRRSRHHRP